MRLGTQGQSYSIMPRLRVRASIVDIAAPCVPRRPLRDFNGKQEARPSKNPLEDRLILEIRRLSEQCNKKLAEIHTITAQLGFAKTKSWVHQTIQYHNRSHLVPALGAEPYLEIPQ